MHEIIHVVDAAPFSGVSRQALEVEVTDDRRLSAGYYFVLWPAAKGTKNRAKRYFGPLRSASEARMLATSALMLGLAEALPARPAIAECRSIVRHAAAANDCSPPGGIERRRVARANA
jgi:hypothetical protein